MNKNNTQKQFCTECGTQKSPLLTGKFDPNTGEKATRMACQNIKCEDGCGNLTGHSNWSCWRNKCLNCGYKQIDY